MKKLITQDYFVPLFLNKIPYLGNILKAFPKMRLYGRRIFSLWKDLKQFVVWQEVESWEWVSLCFQVLAETLLYLFQEFVTFSQIVQ